MRLLLLIATAFLSSCEQPGTKNSALLNSDTLATPIDFNVALTFINEYVSLCSPKSPIANDTNWIRNNPLLTERFKMEYYSLLASAQKNDPELGLNFNPIVDGQDMPDSGFLISGTDPKTGLVTVRGKDWPEYVLVLKVIKQNDKSLVDGSGVINISEDKRAKR